MCELEGLLVYVCGCAVVERLCECTCFSVCGYRYGYAVQAWMEWLCGCASVKIYSCVLRYQCADVQ